MDDFKNAILKMIEISTLIVNNKIEKSRLKKDSPDSNKYFAIIKPKIEEFKREYEKNSPEQYLENLLKRVIKKNNASENYETHSFRYFGQIMRSHCWAAITLKAPHIKHLKATYFPQLYILVSSKGIRFGFSYGKNVESNFIAKVKSDLRFKKKILQLMADHRNLKLYYENQTKAADVKDLIELNNKVPIDSYWSKDTLMIEIFPRTEIPEDIEERIEVLMNSLFNMFDFLSQNSPLKQTNKFHNRKNSIISNLISNKKQIILYGPPGTGKTFNAQRLAEDYLSQNLSYEKSTSTIPPDNKTNLEKRSEQLRNEILMMLKDKSWVDRKSSVLLAKKYNISTQTVAGLKARINKTIIQGKSWSG